MIGRYLLAIIVGFGSGIVIAGGVFAFITIIGIVPRLAQKTETQQYVTWYEDAITFGGIWGASTMIIDYRLPIGTIAVVIFSASIGIFIGCLAVSLAEVLDVIPILTRRLGTSRGIAFFILSVAIGKAIGSILYYVIPGFYRNLG